MIYPIGEQDFAGIRERGLVYVDKTDLVYKMTHESKYYFLSRPRRFGKSLLLSTLKYYFQGEKELFQGLAIEQLETEWQQHPVLRLNFAYGKYNDMEDLYSCLRINFASLEQEFDRDQKEHSFAERFSGIIKRAYEQTGQKSVILIDEYDAPLQAALDKPELMEQYQSELRSIYLCLKNNDEYIRFAFLTGITAWGKVGVFSALNNLKDISIDKDYATLCGITEKELHTVFPESVALLAEENNLTVEDAYLRLKELYDGYHFAVNCPEVYNPFSLLSALSGRTLDNYWIRTGETQFVASLAKNANIDVDTLLNGVFMPRENMLNSKNPFKSPKTFLYQAGYLTLKEYNEDRKEYKLEIPNGEVHESLISHLAAASLGIDLEEDKAADFRGSLRSTFNKGQIEEMITLLNDYIFYQGNCMTMGNKELYFHNTLATVFHITGYNVEVERSTAKGRADLVVKSNKYIYVIELKLDATAQEALDQIIRNGYADPYKTDPRKLVKLGLNFSEQERIIDDFRYEI